MIQYTGTSGDERAAYMSTHIFFLQSPTLQEKGDDDGADENKANAQQKNEKNVVCCGNAYDSSDSLFRILAVDQRRFYFAGISGYVRRLGRNEKHRVGVYGVYFEPRSEYGGSHAEHVDFLFLESACGNAACRGAGVRVFQEVARKQIFYGMFVSAVYHSGHVFGDGV